MFENSSNPGKFCNTVLVLVSYLYMKCFVVPLQMPCVLLWPFSSSVSWQPGSQCWLPSCSVGLVPSCSALVLVCSPGRSVHSCRLPTHIFHLMFNSRSQKEAIDHQNPWKQKYIAFNQRKYGDRGYRNKSILWVPTGNWPIVRRFHFTASFRIIIPPTINTIPT